MMVLRADVKYSHFSDVSEMPRRVQPEPVREARIYGWLPAPSDHNYVVCEAVAILTPPSISIKLRREGQDVDTSILNVERKSLERNTSRGPLGLHPRSL